MAIALQSERELDHDLQEYVNKLDKNPNGNLVERLTWGQIQEKYSAKWVGLNDIEYIDNDGISIKSAVVYFVNRSKDELGMLQALDLTTARYTAPNEIGELSCFLN